MVKLCVRVFTKNVKKSDISEEIMATNSPVNERTLEIFSNIIWDFVDTAFEKATELKDYSETLWTKVSFTGLTIDNGKEVTISWCRYLETDDFRTICKCMHAIVMECNLKVEDYNNLYKKFGKNRTNKSFNWLHKLER